MAGARDEAGYLHVRHLGAGSFGSVAVVERGGSEFVLKSMDTSRYSAKERQRALQEIQILAAMDHVNIVKVRNRKGPGHGTNNIVVMCLRRCLSARLTCHSPVFGILAPLAKGARLLP